MENINSTDAKTTRKHSPLKPPPAKNRPRSFMAEKIAKRIR